MFAQLMRASPWVEPALDAADLLIPMPLSRHRTQERGYNQALVLAKALDATKSTHSILLRLTDAPPQRTLSRRERLRAVAQAYAVDPLQSHRLSGRHLVLIDDVMTTGATLHAAARALRAAGAAHITALVLARTE
jgi:ComF family protein